MEILPRIALGMFVALSLHSSGALAHGGQDGGGNRQSVRPNPPPESLVKAWSALLATRDRIADDIEAGRLNGIHASAARVPEFAQTLMQQTGDLSDSKRSRVKSGVTQLSKVSEHLLGVTEVGDGRVLQGDLTRIDRALRLIRSQFEEGSLPLGAQTSTNHARSHHE